MYWPYPPRLLFPTSADDLYCETEYPGRAPSTAWTDAPEKANPRGEHKATLLRSSSEDSLETGTVVTISGNGYASLEYKNAKVRLPLQ